MRHVIQRQIVELSAPSLAVAQRWEVRMGGLLHDVVTPALERCFDESAGEHTNVLIEHLEVDLGALHEGMSRQEINDRVLSVVRKSLRATGTVPDSGKEGRLAAPVDPASSESRRRELDNQGSTFECFLHFLVHGRLPWWAEAGQVDLEGDWIEHVSSAYVRSTVQTLTNQPAAIERLVRQFSLEFITKLLNLLWADQAGNVLEGWRRLEGSEPAHGTRHAELQREYWIYWISKATGTLPDPSRIIRVLKRWLQDSPEATSRVSFLLEEARSSRIDPSKKSVLAVLEELLAPAVEDAAETTPAEPAKEQIPEQPIRNHHPEKLRDNRHPPVVRERNSPDQNHKAVLEPEPQSIRTSPPAPEKTDFVSNGEPHFRLQEDETGLYVEAAGLVLLHPFLPELFRVARLWKDKEWTSPQAAHAAVLLIAWLAHGEATLPEYRLLMPKLLCGLPWETPLDTSIPLEEDQIRSATELLEAVVGHWRVLGRTSIDGLREGFIQREGRLASTLDGWRLTVEKKALDILLGKLPWGISVIQLPWLRGTRIHVDWA